MSSTIVRLAVCVLAVTAFLSHLQSAEARPALPGFGVCGLDAPTDLAVNDQGDVLYIADTGNHRVILLSQGFGCDAFVLGTEGDGEGEFNAPRGIAIDSMGRIYVADSGNNRLQRFESIEGKNPGDEISFIDFFGTGATLSHPRGLGSDDTDRIYVADTDNSRVVRFDATGVFVDEIGMPEDGDGEQEDGEMIQPVDVDVCPSDSADDAAGRIFVADRGLSAIHVFEPDGTFLLRFGIEGNAPGQLTSPEGIAVDFQCNVYVSDTGSDRTQMFTGNGDFLEVMGIANDPTGIEVSSFQGQGGNTGGVFIANTGSDAVQRFEYINYDTDGDGLIDTDGDALPDRWEEEGIDIGFDGSVELTLPGANPRRKTLYVEIDFTGGITPELAPETPDAEDAIDLVVNAFADAPVENPDGSFGIDLVVERGDDIDNDGELIAFDVGGLDPLADFPELDFFFDNIKRVFFGTPSQRAAANAEDMLFAKGLAYRYGLFVHSICGVGQLDPNGVPECTGSAPFGGIAELPGDDFLVARKAISGAKRQAGAFMHEIGHTLNLRHGGGEDTNCKPNYLSIMNYMFQPWIPNADPALPFSGRLDYSREALDPLDETALNENVGIGLSPMGPEGSQTDYTFWSIDGLTISTERGDRPINWNGDDTIEGSVSQNINAFPTDFCEEGEGTDLHGWDDWSNLRYGFRSTGNFGAGARVEITDKELSDEDYKAIEEYWEDFLAKRYTYSAKFICVPEVGPEGDTVSPGRYRTVINVHNPGNKEVRFLKKAVIARNENEKRGPISPLVEDTLAGDEALSINCKSIADRFEDDVSVGDGFVVIKSNDPLDVVAVYTSRDSVDVEYIAPTVAEEKEQEPKGNGNGDGKKSRADLTIDLPERTRVLCPTGRQCIHSVQVAIENPSAVDVVDPFEVSIKTDNGLADSMMIRSLAAGQSQVFVMNLPPGNNCYNPNCSVEATVGMPATLSTRPTKPTMLPSGKMESEKNRGRLKDKVALHANVAKLAACPKLPNPSSIN